MVAVGDSAEVELIFKAGGRSGGKISKHASVTTNDNSKGNFQLTLKAQIYDEGDSTHAILLLPKSVRFNDDTRNKEIEVKVVNQTKDKLRMRLVSYPLGILDVDVSDKEIKPGDDRKIKVKIDDSFEDKNFSKSFTIELNDNAQTRYTIPVTLSQPLDEQRTAAAARAPHRSGIDSKGERTGK